MEQLMFMNKYAEEYQKIIFQRVGIFAMCTQKLPKTCSDARSLPYFPGGSMTPA